MLPEKETTLRTEVENLIDSKLDTSLKEQEEVRKNEMIRMEKEKD